MIIINIQNITQEADSLNIKNADPSEYYRKNYKPYDCGEISKNTTPLICDCFVDYNDNPEVICDRNGNPVPPISLESLQKKVTNIQRELDDIQKLIDKANSTDSNSDRPYQKEWDELMSIKGTVSRKSFFF